MLSTGNLCNKGLFGNFGETRHVHLTLFRTLLKNPVFAYGLHLFGHFCAPQAVRIGRSPMMHFSYITLRVTADRLFIKEGVSSSYSYLMTNHAFVMTFQQLISTVTPFASPFVTGHYCILLYDRQC